jgi:hypothetical protein
VLVDGADGPQAMERTAPRIAMITLEMSPSMSTIRVYVDRPDGYKNREPYQGIITVKHLGDEVVFLEGAIGKVDRETREKVFQLLRESGIKEVQMERHGKMVKVAM